LSKEGPLNSKVSLNIFLTIIIFIFQNKLIAGFKGKIRDFQEVTTNHQFSAATNTTGDVTHCIIGPDAV